MRVESAAIGSPGARRTSTLQQWATVFLVKHSGGCALLRLALACIIAALPALAFLNDQGAGAKTPFGGRGQRFGRLRGG